MMIPRLQISAESGVGSGVWVRGGGIQGRGGLRGEGLRGQG